MDKDQLLYHYAIRTICHPTYLPGFGLIIGHPTFDRDITFERQVLSEYNSVGKPDPAFYPPSTSLPGTFG